MGKQVEAHALEEEGLVNTSRRLAYCKEGVVEKSLGEPVSGREKGIS